MNELEKTTLGKFITVKHGFAFKGEYFSDKENENVLLTPGNFRIGGGFKDDKFKYYDGEFPSEYILKKDDLVVTMTDLSKDGDTLGFPAKIPCSDNKKFLHNQRIGLVEFLDDNLFKDYLFYLMCTNEYQRTIVNTASGSTVRHTSPTKIREVEFLLPPLPEQKAIAAILSSFDEKIELLRRQNKTLENIAQTIFKEWFINLKVHGQKLKINSKTGLPEGWRIRKLVEIADISIGRTPPRKEEEWFSHDAKDWKWISIRDLGNTEIYIGDTSERLTQEAVETFNIPIIPTNTVVVSFKLTVGRVAITTEEMLSNEAIAHIKLQNNDMLPEYIYLSLKNYNFDLLGSTSSIATAVNSQSIKQIEIIIPNDVVNNSFNILVTPIFNKIKNNVFQIQNLSKLRDLLLPKLMKGEIKVNI